MRLDGLTAEDAQHMEDIRSMHTDNMVKEELMSEATTATARAVWWLLAWQARVALLLQRMKRNDRASQVLPHHH
jgi:hypothetical protein